MEHIFHGCPICNRDVKGNDEHKYYCRHCRILFRKKDLRLSKTHLRFLAKKHIIKKVDRNLLSKIFEKKRN